jgi:hypothetical protein
MRREREVAWWATSRSVWVCYGEKNQDGRAGLGARIELSTNYLYSSLAVTRGIMYTKIQMSYAVPF